MAPVLIIGWFVVHVAGFGTDTLYAQWDPNTVTLAYSANGGSGAPVIRVVMRSVM